MNYRKLIIGGSKYTQIYNRFNNSNVNTKNPPIVNNVHQHQAVAVD